MLIFSNAVLYFWSPSILLKRTLQKTLPFSKDEFCKNLILFTISERTFKKLSVCLINQYEKFKQRKHLSFT